MALCTGVFHLTAMAGPRVGKRVYPMPGTGLPAPRYSGYHPPRWRTTWNRTEIYPRYEPPPGFETVSAKEDTTSEELPIPPTKEEEPDTPGPQVDTTPPDPGAADTDISSDKNSDEDSLLEQLQRNKDKTPIEDDNRDASEPGGIEPEPSRRLDQEDRPPTGGKEPATPSEKGDESTVEDLEELFEGSPGNDNSSLPPNDDVAPKPPSQDSPVAPPANKAKETEQTPTPSEQPKTPEENSPTEADIESLFDEIDQQDSKEDQTSGTGGRWHKTADNGWMASGKKSATTRRKSNNVRRTATARTPQKIPTAPPADDGWKRKNALMSAKLVSRNDDLPEPPPVIEQTQLRARINLPGKMNPIRGEAVVQRRLSRYQNPLRGVQTLQTDSQTASKVIQAVWTETDPTAESEFGGHNPLRQ